MPVEVILPKVDMDMSHGTLATWHVAEGDLVKQGAALFDIETDKAAMEVEAPASGHLHHILAKPGDKVPVGAVIAWLYAEGEAVGAPPGLPAPPSRPGEAAPVAAQPDVVKPAAVAQPVVASRPEDMPATGLRATPAARKSAREAGIALAQVPGTGPLGRIQRADVAGFLHSQSAEPAPRASCWTPEPGPLHVSRRGGALPSVGAHHRSSVSVRPEQVQKAHFPSPEARMVEKAGTEAQRAARSVIGVCPAESYCSAGLTGRRAETMRHGPLAVRRDPAPRGEGDGPRLTGGNCGGKRHP